MRCDSAFASIYDEAGEEIENAEMLFMDQGAYIYRAYSNGHPYDTAQVLNLLNHLSNSISTKTEGLRVDRLEGLVSSLRLFFRSYQTSYFISPLFRSSSFILSWWSDEVYLECGILIRI